LLVAVLALMVCLPMSAQDQIQPMDGQTVQPMTKICPNCGGTIDMVTGQHISGPTHAPRYAGAAYVNPDTGTVTPITAANAPASYQSQQPAMAATVYSYSASPVVRYSTPVAVQAAPQVVVQQRVKPSKFGYAVSGSGDIVRFRR
jgi:hypothetical protein